MESFLNVLDIQTKWQVLLFVGLYLAKSEIKAAIPGLPSIITKAPGGWEFQALQEVHKEVAAIAGVSEVQKDSTRSELKVDPK